MAAEKISKKLPKRAAKSHPKHDKRMGHKARAQKKKAARRAVNDAAARRNTELRAAGLPTPWEVAKSKRAARRHK